MSESGENLGSGPRFITATLQSNFNYCIGEFLQRMNQGYVYESWIALETLHSILPPEIYDNKTVRQYFNEVKNFLSKSNGNSRSNFMDQRKETQEILGYLKARNLATFRIVYAMLYKGGYLEKIRSFETGSET